jgi:hypothetical protein
MAYERKEIRMLKICLRVSKTKDQHQLFINSLSLVVIVEKVTYNLVNLKDQNSLNIGHNANPTFPLMNNQSNLFEDTRGFIIDTPKDMKLDFFFLLLAFVVSFFN